MRKIFLYIATAIIVLGCSKAYVGDSGETAEEYFSKFKYKQTSGDVESHRYLFSGLVPMLDATVEEQIYFVGDLYLLENNEFVFDYKEIRSEEFIFEKRVRDTYKIDGVKLVLPGVGTAAGLTYNNQDVIELTFEDNYNTEGLKGLSKVFFYIQSGKGLEE